MYLVDAGRGIAEALRAAQEGASPSLADSPIVASHREDDVRVQDAYSIRCTPAVHGAARDTLDHVDAVAARG